MVRNNRDADAKRADKRGFDFIFRPMSHPSNASTIDPRAYRNTIGAFATGVTVVAAGHGHHLHAMTANAVTSLSLDPPLLIFCVGKKARIVEVLETAHGFSVNILRDNQQALSTYFAGGWKEPVPPPFRFVPWEGGPRLEGCAASIGCALHERIEGGDHWIVVGRVVALHQGEEPQRPLIFYSGKYRHLDAASVPAPDLEQEPPPIQIFYDPWQVDQ